MHRLSAPNEGSDRRQPAAATADDSNKPWLTRFARDVCKNRYNSTLCCLVSLSAFSLVIALAIPALINKLANDEINKQVVIDSPENPNYQSWLTNVNGPGAEIQIYYDIYYFDLQNPTEVLQGAVPTVAELGPYAFNEYFTKIDVSWSSTGDEVTYNTQRYYTFNQARTNPGLSQFDKVTVPYPVTIAFQYYLSKIPVPATELVDAKLQAGIYGAYNNVDAQLKALEDTLDPGRGIMTPKRRKALSLTISVDNGLTNLYTGLASFVNVSNPADVLMKLLLCPAPMGNSPFWETPIAPGYFGWLNDPVLTEVQKIIDLVVAKNESKHLVIPWTTAVPGAAVNYTSEDEVRRRRNPDTLKTGKSNVLLVSQYVRYNNMTDYWSCAAPMDSQNTSLYIEGEQFPACELYQYEWTPEEAAAKGYQQPFATYYANRVEGTDANMFGRPMTGASVEVFISDICRSLYLINVGTVDWYGVPVHRLGISYEDVLNATNYPANGQYYSLGPDGLANLTSGFNIPIFASFPHYLHGDPGLLASIKGMTAPNPSIHESLLDVEPNTGLLVRASKRLQINYKVNKKLFPTLPATVLGQLNETCANLTALVSFLYNASSPLVDQATVYALANATVALCAPESPSWAFVDCMSQQTDWALPQDTMFLPYAWVDEHFELSEADAAAVQGELLSVLTFAQNLQFWGLIVFGFLASLIGLFVAAKWLLLGRDGKLPDLSSAAGSPLDFKNNFQYSPLTLRSDGSVEPAQMPSRGPSVSRESETGIATI